MPSGVCSRASATPPNLPPARKSGQRVVSVSDGLLIRRLVHARCGWEVMKKSTLSPLTLMPKASITSVLNNFVSFSFSPDYDGPSMGLFSLVSRM